MHKVQVFSSSIGRHRFQLMAAFISVTLFNQSCVHEPVIPSTPEISFQNEVMPIIKSNCAIEGCHVHNSTSDEDLLPLTSYAEIMNILVPGDANNSELYNVITTLSGEKAMPPQSPLSEDQVRILYVWISQGAKNN